MKFCPKSLAAFALTGCCAPTMLYPGTEDCHRRTESYGHPYDIDRPLKLWLPPPAG